MVIREICRVGIGEGIGVRIGEGIGIKHLILLPPLLHKIVTRFSFQQICYKLFWSSL